MSANGLDPTRRQLIVQAMNDRNHKGRRDAETFVSKVARFDTMKRFLNEGREADIRHVEQLLGITS